MGGMLSEWDTIKEGDSSGVEAVSQSGGACVQCPETFSLWKKDKQEVAGVC